MPDDEVPGSAVSALPAPPALPTRLSPPGSATVSRSSPPHHANYPDYAPWLRRDFWFSCAYCTLTECEAGGVTFGVDHYHPKSKHPSLATVYDNLMYSCLFCNSFKGDREPSAAAEAAGMRLYRPDTDAAEDHFGLTGRRLEPKSPIGRYTIALLDLNRQPLQRTRELRERLHECADVTLGGLRRLATLRLDKVGAKHRLNVQKHVNALGDQERQMREALLKLIEDLSRSVMLDEDPESKERSKHRRRELRILNAVAPALSDLEPSPIPSGATEP